MQLAPTNLFFGKRTTGIRSCFFLKTRTQALSRFLKDVFMHKNQIISGILVKFMPEGSVDQIILTRGLLTSFQLHQTVFIRLSCHHVTYINNFPCKEVGV